MKYPLSCDTWGQEELDAIQRVVDSGRFTMGPEVEKFEKQFAEFFGVKHAKMVNSGSSANLLMMQSLRYSTDYPISPLDGVIVPAVSWSTTFYPVCQAGFQLIFADVDKDTLNICPKSVRDILEKNPDCARAILAVNLLGNPADLYELRQIANEYDLILLEDNCESLGSYLPDGEYCGTYGDIGTFSFFFSHHLQTMEGGMITTNNDKTAQYIDSMRAHGWLRTLPDKNLVHHKSGDPFEDSFRFVLPGYSVRPLEMSGATGQAQLAKWPDMMKVRQENAEHFKRLFSTLDNVTIQEENGTSSYFGFSVLVDVSINRKKITDALIEAGVEIRPIVAGNFLKNPVMRHLDYEAPTTYCNADHIHNKGFFLGNDSVDIKDKIGYAYDIIKQKIEEQNKNDTN